ncbi:gliding motility lipoprotein GldH [Cecembia sp.]|uniref:gliding motility lipoprotein GldH n=1 Tax=Cecembia sp. TaxID=1898110 RepID=UPI0025C0DF58|nr:gliding motility lipoprotein GldH [Cecembia sp.]
MIKVLYSLFILAVFGSCSGDRVYEKYQGMKNLSWGVQDTVSFTMTKPLPEGPSILAIKYNENYPYRNLYLRYLVLDSLEDIIASNLINIDLFESTSGKPLGKGYGNTFTKYDTLPLEGFNPYNQIQLVQYMRIEELDGIEAIGLKRIKN